MKIVVCGGTPSEQEKLCHLLEHRTQQWHVECEIQCFDQGESFLQGIAKGTTCDYLIVQLPLSGMEGTVTALQARALLPGMEIAFLAQQEARDCAVEAFILNALHYIAQPVTEAVVEELLLRYVRKTGLEIEAIPVKIGGAVYQLPVRYIEMVVSAGRKCNIYLWNKDEPLCLPMTFSRVKALLKSENYLMVSRGFLVHMDSIQIMTTDGCTLRNGASLLLSRGNRVKLRKTYQDYCKAKIQREQERYLELLRNSRMEKALMEHIRKTCLQKPEDQD